MERYSRRNHAQRHYRVARREATLSPQTQMVKMKKKAPIFMAVGVMVLVLLAVKWFFIGYLVGKRHD